MTVSQRLRSVDTIRDRLTSRGSPRRQMAVIVCITAVTGLLASYTLLHLGVTRMAVRYPVSVAIAYAVFLACLWYWLRRHRLRVAHREAYARRSDWLDGLDVVDVPFSFDGPSVEMPEPAFGGGGGFAGAGGGSSWTESLSSGQSAPAAAKAGLHGTARGGGGSSSFDLDFDEGGVVLVVLAVVAAIAASVGIYVVYIAPSLFAEMILDAALAAGLYHRVREMERAHWVTTALRHTIVPVVMVAAIVALAGGFAQALYPNAVSIGRVVEQARAKPATSE